MAFASVQHSFGICWRWCSQVFAFVGVAFARVGVGSPLRSLTLAFVGVGVCLVFAGAGVRLVFVGDDLDF